MTGPSAGPWAAIDARIAAEPTRPLLTCYLDPPETGPGAGESDRIDLTGTTWTTWVAKTVNLLQEIGGVPAGGPARVLLRLPPHWQTAVWTEACLRLGAQVELVGTGPAATGGGHYSVVATGPQDLTRALADDADEVVVLPLLPMNGVSPTPVPAGVWDYAAEVSAFADRTGLPAAAVAAAAVGARLSWGGAGPLPAAADGAALDGAALDGAGLDWAAVDGAGLVAAADARADGAGLAPGGRLLATGTGPGGPWVDLLAAARRGGSLVLAPDAAALDPARAARRWAAERVTATVGTPPPR